MDDAQPPPHRLNELLAKTTRAAHAASTAEGEQVFASLAGQLADILGVGATMIATAVAGRPDRMLARAIWLDGRLLQPFEYDLAETPCRAVIGRESRFVASGVRDEFAPGSLFHVNAFDSYAARSLFDGSGRQLGLIVAMDRRPMSDAQVTEAVLQIFAVRATAELERERGEAVLRASEASYRSIFEANEDAIFVHDWATGAILDVSPKASQLYGHPRETLRRLRVGDISLNLPPFTERDALARIEEAKQRPGPVRFEWRGRHRDGHLMWHEVTLKRAEIAGEPRVLAFVRDITEQRRTEEAVRASEAQYRAIFNASADALMLWDGSLQRVDVNPAHEKIFGFAREDVVGRGFDGLPYPEELVRPRIEMLRRALAGEACRAELEALRKDGQRIITELRTIPFLHHGEPHVLQIARDITERKRVEQALRASEEQYRSIFNASADALVLRDAAFRIVDVNATYEAMSGRARDEVIGSDRVLANPPEAREAIRALHERALAGEPVVFETQLVRRDGARYDLELRGVPIRHRGEPHVLYMGRDITARRRAEDQQRELQAQLRQVQKMEAIGQLTGGIAHDFNNILASIMGYVGLALERPATAADGKLAEYLEQAEQGCRRARDLIQQMLAFSRGRQGDRQALALAGLVDESLRLLRATFPSSIAYEVEATDPSAVAEVDPVQMQQVLLNLGINARDAIGGAGRIRFGVAGGVVVEAACASCGQPLRGVFHRLWVADSGPGIPPPLRKRIFEPFFSTKAPGHGTGMGLATVHRIVHDHGGHLLVGTDRGARFDVLLPPGGTAAQAPPAAAPARAAHGRALRGRVLLVDDEESVLGFMRELLLSWGLEVVAMRRAPAARDLIAAGTPAIDLVLTDQTMPELGGVDLAHAVHALRPGLPVLLYSGHADLIDVEALKQSGIRRVLRKPLEPALLRAAVEDCLGDR